MVFADSKFQYFVENTKKKTIILFINLRSRAEGGKTLLQHFDLIQNSPVVTGSLGSLVIAVLSNESRKKIHRHTLFDSQGDGKGVGSSNQTEVPRVVSTQ